MGVINATWGEFYAASGYDVQTIYNIAVTTENDSFESCCVVS